MTFEKLHGDPPIAGAALQGLQISPQGDRVTFLQAAEDDAERLDLWEFDLETGERRVLVRSTDLLGGAEETLSSEELARRERQRIRATGIVGYQWSADGEMLLFPLNGDVYLYELKRNLVHRVTETDAAEIDAKLSPNGRYVSYVREGDLYVFDLYRGSNELIVSLVYGPKEKEERERRLTDDADETVVNGTADFLAQEEMGRFSGYWWSPDSKRIAYQRNDESGVAIITRTEATADGVTTVDQRYPRAGAENPRIDLYVINVSGRRARRLMRFNQDDYLARVEWSPHGGSLLVQRQNRDQTRLELLRVDLDGDVEDVMIEEDADTWVNLHDDLVPLPDGRLIWTSERTGYRHIYLREVSGALRPITAGAWVVDNIACVDPERERVFFHGWREDPRQRHIFTAPFESDDPGTPTRLSARPGWHDVSFDTACETYIDAFSTAQTPIQTSLHGPDGERRIWLEKNALDAKHPWTNVHAERPASEWGTLAGPDGAELYYRLLKPRAFEPGRRYPAVHLVYGGPRVQTVADRWGRFNLLGRVLADAGYVVFWLDNRGSGRRGKAFEDPIHRRMAGAEVEDQRAGLEWLSAQPFVDPDRIGVHGWSYGGYMTLHLLARAGDLLAAGVAGAPVTDWALYDTHYTERYMGTPQEYPEGYAAAGVFGHLEGFSPALLLVHGMADDNVIVDNSLRLMEALQKAGVLFETSLYPGEPHGLRDRVNRIHFGRSMLDFFERRLPARDSTSRN